MESKPRKSGSKSLDLSQERPAGPARGSLSADHPDRPSSAPPSISQGPSQSVEALLPVVSIPTSVVKTLLEQHVPAIDSAFDGQVASMTTPSATSVTPALTPASGGARSAALPPSSSQSPASLTMEVIVGDALGVLRNIAKGARFPGVKGIFDTIIKVIGLIEVSKLYRPLRK
jgi:hypothetical protein